MFRGLRNSILSLLSPQECHVCSNIVDNLDDGIACAACWSATRIFDGQCTLCTKCGAYFDGRSASGNVLCHKCDEHNYDRAFAVGVYEKALAATVIELKKTPHIPTGLLARLKAAVQWPELADTDLIVPVPLSRKRRLERGYNQAEVIGDAIAKLTGIEQDTLSLERTKDSAAHRVAMDMKARDLTVRNTFEVKRPKLIRGRNILLVDDVFTSGSTSSHCAKILKKNGAGKVNVLTLARAVFD